MGRLRAKTDYESLRKARILENQARLASLGVQKAVSELRSLTSSAKSGKRKWHKVDYSSTPLRRSNRLKGKSCISELSVKGESGLSQLSDVEDDGEKKRPANAPLMRVKRMGRMGRLRAKTDYESLRKARILENQARLASLGVQKAVSELRSLTSSAKSGKRKWHKVDYSSTPLRRSNRLKGKSCISELSVKGESGLSQLSDVEDDGEKKRPANAPLMRVKRGEIAWLSPDALARRCSSKGRGSLYDPTYGICCHFCRQKKLCGEEDCRRCGDLDMDQPCIGKTDCSVCHSSNGVLCRACLKVRYGEEIEDVRANQEWMCPHCVEEKGTKPYWICNSSFCLKKRNMAPTGIAIFKAREMGYESVAHYLMDRLRKADKRGG
ncbi:cell division cycle-associated protein 7-like isoform X2 [Coffea eugenioides]|uniref:Zinc-finger domain-containing protein n=1 Tax=Coffea arabica TaxID=13443 RepID=A0A6P6XDE8_COFAR|nr:cell division cycle-associated protein 7-like [Coffea arabica]XP_027168497.1 cell division cycle-associated protein 7-like isoform X2 [Coffea eugenioides]